MSRKTILLYSVTCLIMLFHNLLQADIVKRFRFLGYGLRTNDWGLNHKNASE